LNIEEVNLHLLIRLLTYLAIKQNKKYWFSIKSKFKCPETHTCRFCQTKASYGKPIE
jgi:hypothetical protein